MSQPDWNCHRRECCARFVYFYSGYLFKLPICFKLSERALGAYVGADWACALWALLNGTLVMAGGRALAAAASRWRWACYGRLCHHRDNGTAAGADDVAQFLCASAARHSIVIYLAFFPADGGDRPRACCKTGVINDIGTDLPARHRYQRYGRAQR